MLNVVRVLALDEPQKDWPAAVGDASRHLLPVSRVRGRVSALFRLFCFCFVVFVATFPTH